MKLQDLIEKYAVKNALDYNGKCNVKAVMGKVLAENPELRPKAPEVLALVEKTAKQMNKLSAKEQEKIASKYKYEKKAKKEEHKLKELPDAEKGVVMRFAPFPSGPLHLGNARAAILNDEYVRRYKGKLILAIDDTAGSKDKPPIAEAYTLIPEGLEWLGVKVHRVYYKSDNMPVFYKYAKLFLKKGWAYVCTCPPAQLTKNREKGIECSHRTQKPNKNLELFTKMLEGGFKEGEAVIRLKTSMRHKDPAFRDRVLLRISDVPHPRVGNTYKVWPMLEFSWAIDDHLLGITHILRGKDLVMEDKMERYMWDLLGWNHPHILHNGLMKIEGAKISKSKSALEVERGEYEGWDDPRTWSLQSLKKRGIKPEAIRNFILSIGVSENNITVPIENLYRENRVLIEKEADRYFFVPEPLRIEIQAPPDETEKTEKKVKLPLHPDYPERGYRTIPVKAKDGKYYVYVDRKDVRRRDFVRLKGLFNVEFASTGKEAKYAGDSYKDAVKKRTPIIQWVPDSDYIEAMLVMPDGSRVKGLCEPAVKRVSKGNVIQFERVGFCRLEDPKRMLFYFTHP